MELRETIRGLRKALGMTQETLADRSALERVEISNLESGRNQATSVRIFRGLARGFGLDLQQAADLLDGVLSVEAAAAAARQGPRAGRTGRELAADLAREAGVSERAISQILAEPITPETERRPTLWWADCMRRLDLDLLAAAPAARAAVGAGVRDDTPVAQSTTKPIRRR